MWSHKKKIKRNTLCSYYNTPILNGKTFCGAIYLKILVQKVNIRSNIVKANHVCKMKGGLNMSIQRNVSIVKEKTVPPYYVLAAEWNVNGKSFKGLVAFEDDKNLGKFDLGEFKKLLNLFPNTNSEVQILKHLIRENVYEEIKSNY